MRILVADDEFLIALDMEMTLREAGAEVVGPCATLSAALAAAEQPGLSAAVLDVRLGHDTTEDVADRLLGRGIPFLFCSGQAIPETIRAKIPAARLVPKPVPYGALLDSLLILLGRRR